MSTQTGADHRDDSPEPRASASPLALAALSLLTGACDASELRDRFAEHGALVSTQRCHDLLSDLAGLGLARVASRVRDDRPPRYARTLLGDRLVAASIGGAGPLSEQLAELEQLRGELFTTVAHELRTPLTSILTSVGLLLDPNTEPDERQHEQLLAAIERNAKRLQHLADDVLDLARFRTGHVRLARRRFDARQVPAEVANSLAPALARRGQSVVLTAPDDALWVFADHRRVERALLNLLSNGHKFSPDGARIAIDVARRDGEVVFAVTDSGPGISADQQAHLFERFFVGATDRAGSGTGLGLPIALAIAQAHGGRIEVESRPGSGSTFRLVIPAASDPGVTAA